MGELVAAAGRHRRGPDGAGRQRGDQGARRHPPPGAPLPADGLRLGGAGNDGRQRSPGRADDQARSASVHGPGDGRSARLAHAEPHRHPLRLAPGPRQDVPDPDDRPAETARDRWPPRPGAAPPAAVARRLAEPGAGGHARHPRESRPPDGDPGHRHRPQGPRLRAPHARGSDQPDKNRPGPRPRCADRGPLPRHPPAQIPHHPAAQPARRSNARGQERAQGARGGHLQHVREPHPRRPQHRQLTRAAGPDPRDLGRQPGPRRARLGRDRHRRVLLARQQDRAGGRPRPDRRPGQASRDRGQARLPHRPERPAGTSGHARARRPSPGLHRVHGRRCRGDRRRRVGTPAGVPDLPRGAGPARPRRRLIGVLIRPHHSRPNGQSDYGDNNVSYPFRHAQSIGLPELCARRRRVPRRRTGPVRPSSGAGLRLQGHSHRSHY